MVEQFLEFNDHDDIHTQDDFYNFYDDNELSYHHKVSDILDNCDWNDMTDIIRNMDSEPGMSLSARKQAKYHKNNLLSIRRKLVKENLIVRTIYKGYSSYIGSANEFQQKSSKYIKQTGIYLFINDVNPRNPSVSQQCLNNIIKQVVITFNYLLSSKLISNKQCILMYPNLSCTRLNYLYFVPDTSNEEIPLHPIIICKNGPTMNIACYLNRLLWSIFNQITGCKTYLNSADIVYDLEQYVKNGYLQETTHFVTFNINNICTTFHHEMAINALEKFLHIHRSEFETIAEGLSNETIIQLVRLVLENQFFIHENKLYRQIYGGASGSLLTIPLACIYLFYGQSLSMINMIKNNDNKLLFGRYRDDFFLTWNDSKDQFLTLFNEIMINNAEHSIMKPITVTIESSIYLLDLELSHHQGHLYTKIHHDSMNNNYDLPSTFDYDSYQSSNLLKAALQHAVQCCSNEKDFDYERIRLDVSYLMHGFSPSFIDKCITEFYNEVDIETEEYFRFSNIPYQTLRQHVIDKYEQQIASKKQQQQLLNNEKEKILRIPYPNLLDAQMANNIKNELLYILKVNSSNKEIFNDIEFELVPRPQTPLTINDFLINKQPPLRMLMVSNDK